MFSRAISQPNVRFELNKLTWIANIYSATVVFWVRTDFPCQTFQTISSCPQPLKFGATARGSTGYGLVPELLKDAFKLNMDIIYGYRNAELAVERGEVHASGGDLIGFMGGRPRQLMEEGKVKILLQVAGRRDAELSRMNVPWSMEVIPDQHKKLFLMVNPILDLARPYFAPPKIPADRAKILQTLSRSATGGLIFAGARADAASQSVSASRTSVRPIDERACSSRWGRSRDYRQAGRCGRRECCEGRRIGPCRARAAAFEP